MNSKLEEISAQELNDLLSQNQEAVNLIDVREYPEYAAGHLNGAQLIPLGQLPKQLDKWDRKHKTILVCRSGKRSADAQNILREQGINNVCHLKGGLLAWEQSGASLQRANKAPWALERQVRVAAGSLVLLGVILSWLVHSSFVGISAFVGAGLVFAGITDWCGMGLLLAKMPWNKRPKIS